MNTANFLRLAGEALPELSYLFETRVEIRRTVSEIELFLDEPGTFAIRGLRMKRPSEIPYEVTSSPVAAGNPADLLSGKVLRLKMDDRPHWRIRFAEPIHLRRLSLTMQYGPGGEQSYGLNVRWRKEDGEWQLFAFASAANFMQRLDDLAAVLTQARSAIPEPDPQLDAFLQTLDAHFVAVSRALTTGEADWAQLRDGRRRALAALVAVSRSPGALRQIGAEPGILRLIRALIWRGSDAACLEPDETTAVLLLLAGNLLDGKWVTLRTLRVYRTVLRAMSVSALERALDELFVAMGGNPAALPIRLRKHGISPSWLLACRREAAEGTQAIMQSLAALGYASFINYGTLLGAVRDGLFIPHDDDIDITYLSAARDKAGVVGELKRMITQLGEMGYTVWYSATMLLHVSLPGIPVVFDIWPAFEAAEGSLTMHMHKLKLAEVPKSAIVPLGKVELEGVALDAPGDPPAFLQQRYGASWPEPNPFFDLSWTRGGKFAAP